MLNLRDYQIEAVEAIWNEIKSDHTALAVLSTGLGKTEIIIGLIKKSLQAYPSLKCVFLVNKVNLLKQTERRLTHHLGDVVGVFYGKERVLKNITVATIQSISSIPENNNLIIVDEVHNLNQKQGKYIEYIKESKDKNPRLKVIGVTATDFREDGYIYGKGKLFEKVCFRKGLLWAQEHGFLVPIKYKHQPEQFNTSVLRIRAGEYRQEDIDIQATDINKATKQILDAIPQLENRKKVVWSCSSIVHCELISNLLNNVGEEAVLIHSKMTDEQRLDSTNRFEKGSARHLVFVTIVSEGYDFPPIDAVVLMRPTRSAIRYVQTVGRGLRISEGKVDCLVLDYGNIYQNLGPVDDPVVHIKGQSKKTPRIATKFCPACLSYTLKSTKICTDCGHDFFKDQKKVNLENLTHESFKEIPVNIEEITFVEIFRKVSKSGNSMDVIRYNLNCLYPRFIDEFFLDWKKSVFQIRLRALGINEPDYNIKIPVKSEIQFFKKPNGYFEVQHVE